ncbi:MAG: trypsin-like peptidase domain-containing protein [Actinomycetota bacterium]
MNLRFRAFVLSLAVMLGGALLVGCSDDRQGSREENVAQEPAQAPESIPENEPVARVAAQVEPSVVQVNVRAIQTTPLGPQEQEGVGSGVIYRSDGYIITNDHVVAGADRVNVAFADGTTLQGEVIGGDPRTDIAVVKVDRNNLPAASFSDSDDLIVGQLAVAIGSPSGFESTVTAGVISGLNREIPPQITGGGVQIPSLVDLIQTDAAISPGNSGGALANRDGEVVGINAAYLPPGQTGAENIGFAIPSTTATEVAEQLIETGEVSTPYIGIGLSDLTPRIAEQFGLSVESGVLVTEVGQGTPAAEAGLRQGDIVTAIDDEQVEDSGDLLAALRDYRPGDKVELTIVRGGEEQSVNLTLAERPEQG